MKPRLACCLALALLALGCASDEGDDSSSGSGEADDDVANDTRESDDDAPESEPEPQAAESDVPEGCPEDRALGDGSALCADYASYLCGSLEWVEQTAAALGVDPVEAAVCVGGGSDFSDDGSSSATSCWLHEHRPCTVPYCMRDTYDELVQCALGELVPETCQTCASEAIMAQKMMRACQAYLRTFVGWCNDYGPGGFECPEAACNPNNVAPTQPDDPSPAPSDDPSEPSDAEPEVPATAGCTRTCEKDFECGSGDFETLEECVAGCSALDAMGGECAVALQSLQACATPLDCEQYLMLAEQQPADFPCAAEFTALRAACASADSMDDPL
jgi:hypothetical protein